MSTPNCPRCDSHQTREYDTTMSQTRYTCQRCGNKFEKSTLFGKVRPAATLALTLGLGIFGIDALQD